LNLDPKLWILKACSLTCRQLNQVRQHHGIYGVDTGRICVVALNRRNLRHVTEAMAQAYRMQAVAKSP